VTLAVTAAVLVAAVPCVVAVASASLGTPSNPAPSCSALFRGGLKPSGRYWLSISGQRFSTYCDMEARHNGGGWTNIVYVPQTLRPLETTREWPSMATQHDLGVARMFKVASVCEREQARACVWEREGGSVCVCVSGRVGVKR
jgi:hypothetical protein